MHQSSNSKEYPEYSSPISEKSLDVNTSPKILAFAGVVLVTALGLLGVISQTWKPQNINQTPVENLPENLPENLTENSEDDSVEILTGKEIKDSRVLETLKQKLYQNLDQSWTTPVTGTSIYRVRVDQKGQIVSYQPQNSAASENLNNTPLPGLIEVDSPAAGDKPSLDFAEFEVIFNQTGKLVVNLLKPD